MWYDVKKCLLALDSGLPERLSADILEVRQYLTLVESFNYGAALYSG